MCAWVRVRSYCSAVSGKVDANTPVLFFQVEADLGYPGGKAKIVHKESDIIMAFAINKVEEKLL